MRTSPEVPNEIDNKIVCKIQGRLIAAYIGLSVTIAALVSYVIYLEVKETKTDVIFKTPETKTEILRIYGDFFKTPAEQLEVEKLFFTDPNATMTAPVQNVTDSGYFKHVCRYFYTNEPDEGGRPSVTTNRPDKPSKLTTASNVPFTNPELTPDFTILEIPESVNRRRRNSESVSSIWDSHWRHGDRYKTIYHGCCKTVRTFLSPSTAISDQTRREVRLVHYGREKRQYFQTDTCVHDYNCPLECGCQKQVGLFMALVHNPNFGRGPGEPEYIVQSIQLGGSCKCVNQLRPNV